MDRWVIKKFVRLKSSYSSVLFRNWRKKVSFYAKMRKSLFGSNRFYVTTSCVTASSRDDIKMPVLFLWRMTCPCFKVESPRILILILRSEIYIYISFILSSNTKLCRNGFSALRHVYMVVTTVLDLSQYRTITTILPINLPAYDLYVPTN